MGFVYLIHLEKPLAHAKHYVGFCYEDVQKRLKRHRSGGGAKMLAACNRAKINYDIVHVWSDVDKNFERKLKNNSHVKQYCPLCNGKGNTTQNQQRSQQD